MADAILCKFNQGAFHPDPRLHNYVAEHFVDGAAYWLNMEPVRSERSHKHEFAWLKTAWQNLPESIAHEYPSSEHLRKRALIQAGLYDEQVIDAGSNAAAIRVAQGVRAFPGEVFSMVFVRGQYVVIRRPQSQSYKAMGAKRFQESKQAVLEIVADLCGVDPSAFNRAEAA